MKNQFSLVMHRAQLINYDYKICIGCGNWVLCAPCCHFFFIYHTSLQRTCLPGRRVDESWEVLSGIWIFIYIFLHTFLRTRPYNSIFLLINCLWQLDGKMIFAEERAFHEKIIDLLMILSFVDGKEYISTPWMISSGGQLFAQCFTGGLFFFPWYLTTSRETFLSLGQKSPGRFTLGK